MTFSSLLLSLPTWLPAALVGLLFVLLILLYRWRWRDYALPARLTARATKSSGVNTEAPAEVTEGLFKPADGLAAQAAGSPFDQPAAPRMSLVIPCYNCDEELAVTVRELLTQDFADFEIVLVDEASTDDTRDLLRHLAELHPCVRTTFVPETARYVDRRKLAITLGVRAARAEWVVVTRSDVRPDTTQWLSRLYEKMNPDVDFVIGYANYGDDGTPPTRRAIFEHLRRQLRCYRAAQGRAVGADITNLALRRRYFLEGRGYEQSLTVPCGEDYLLVDALATRGRTAVCACATAAVHREAPYPTLLTEARTTLCETLHHLSRRGRLYLWREHAAACCTYLFLLTLLVYIGLRTATTVLTATYPLPYLAPDIAAFFALVIVITLPTCLLRRTCRVLGERTFSFLLMMHYALLQPWRGAAVRLRRFRHRHEFVRR